MKKICLLIVFATGFALLLAGCFGLGIPEEALPNLARPQDKCQNYVYEVFTGNVLVTAVGNIDEDLWNCSGFVFDYEAEPRSTEDLVPQNFGEPCIFYLFAEVDTGQIISLCQNLIEVRIPVFAADNIVVRENNKDPVQVSPLGFYIEP